MADKSAERRVSLFELGFRFLPTRVGNRTIVYVHPYGARLEVHPEADIPDDWYMGPPTSVHIRGGTHMDATHRRHASVPAPNQMSEDVPLLARWFTGRMESEYGHTPVESIKEELRRNRVRHPRSAYIRAKSGRERQNG
jgi:hypothetical protein